MDEIKCPHIDNSNKKVYVYEIAENTEIHLCSICNMNLAGEMMKQLAKETYISEVVHDDE